MRLITKQYFLDNLENNKLIKKYIPNVSRFILGDGMNWESTCYFELENSKMFFLDYNLDAIFVPSKYEITKEELMSENLITDDWTLTYLSNKPKHTLNNLHKSFDWNCQYDKNNKLFFKLLNLKNGSWKLENNRINETIIFSLIIEKLFNSEAYLYIGIDELSIFPFKEKEIKNKIHFIRKLIEWKVEI